MFCGRGVIDTLGNAMAYEHFPGFNLLQRVIWINVDLMKHLRKIQEKAHKPWRYLKVQ